MPPVDGEAEELLELDEDAGVQAVRLRDVQALLERLAEEPPTVAGLTAPQLAGVAGDLAAILEGYADVSVEAGEDGSVELGELREIFADVLFDDEDGEATLEPGQHGATLAGAVALANLVLQELAG